VRNNGTESGGKQPAVGRAVGCDAASAAAGGGRVRPSARPRRPDPDASVARQRAQAALAISSGSCTLASARCQRGVPELMQRPACLAASSSAARR
jgi:hypothetical protein